MLVSGALKRRDWQKINVAVNNSKQLVSHGEAVAARATAEQRFVISWRVISQLSGRLKEPSNLNVSLWAFPRTTG